MNKEIIINGKKIFYRTYGSGKPVMFVHGFGETGDVWEPPQTPPGEGFGKILLNEDLLKREGFKLIIPDLPGSGKSEMIEDMSIDGMAEVLKIIFDTEYSQIPGPGKPGWVLIGHSMGGYIALAFAAKYGSYLGGLGLFHSTAYADSEEKKAIRRKGIEFIKEHGAFEFLKTATPNLFSPLSKQRSPGLVSQFIESLKDQFSDDALIAYYQAMINRPERIHVLKNAGVPVLFAMGEYDNAVPLQDGLKQCHLPRQSHIHIFHQSGHMGMLEEKEKSNQILQQFLAAI